MALFADIRSISAARRPGKLPATNIWLWGLGKQPRLPPFADAVRPAGRDDHGRRSAARPGRADRLASGSRCPGATGYTDTDYAAKGRYAIEALADDRPGLRPRRGDRRGLARRRRGGQDPGAGGDRPAHRRARCTRPCGARATIASWSRPTIPRRCAPRRTATAPCRWRCAGSRHSNRTRHHLRRAIAAARQPSKAWHLPRRLERLMPVLPVDLRELRSWPVAGYTNGIPQAARPIPHPEVVHSYVTDRAEIRRHERGRPPRRSRPRPARRSALSARATRW